MSLTSNHHLCLPAHQDGQIWQCLVVCALVALAVRTAIVIAGPWFQGDALVYANVARNLFHNGCISMDAWAASTCARHWGGNQLPGYPTFIAATWRFFWGKYDGAFVGPISHIHIRSLLPLPCVARLRFTQYVYLVRWVGVGNIAVVGRLVTRSDDGGVIDCRCNMGIGENCACSGREKFLNVVHRDRLSGWIFLFAMILRLWQFQSALVCLPSMTYGAP